MMQRIIRLSEAGSVVSEDLYENHSIDSLLCILATEEKSGDKDVLRDLLFYQVDIITLKNAALNAVINKLIDKYEMPG